MSRYPSADALLAEAVAEGGHDDFGPGDFRDGLAVLLDSLEHDGDVDPAVDAAVIGDLRRRLVNRLQVETYYAEHPELDEAVIRGPIDINGLPRTGTTALADMLSLDPQLRSLRGWEQTRPVPPPVAGDEANDPRRQAFIAHNEARSPDYKAMHIFEVDATMEDTEVLGMAFHGQQMTLPVAGYRRWWRRADLTETYAYHRRVVTLLGSKSPPDLWLFKAPHHKFHLEALVAAYPDIRFVMTHRDPAKVVPSYASIVSSILPKADGERDVVALGREISEHLREGMENAIAARARIGEERFLDVHHRELVADPEGTVRRIYDWLGLELTPSTWQAISAWQEANRVGAQGTHRYTAEQYGLTAAQIRSDYDFYIRHFDVTVERA
ncbi:MAG TPA: sulfotransferase [Mycobacteriales bacterium]|nr:sulfotransferase [Mycobacteriales bacterium]